MILKPIFTLKENTKVELAAFVCGIAKVCIRHITFAWLARKHNS